MGTKLVRYIFIIISIGCFAFIFKTYIVFASGCTVEYFNTNPGSPVVEGNDVLMEGKGHCNGGVRAVRFTVDGDSKAETSLPEQREYFRTKEYGPGDHELCFWVAGGSDARWEAGAKNCKTYTVLPTSSNDSGDSSDSSGEITPGTCRIEYFKTTPSSPVDIEVDVLMEGKGSCDGGVRAVRFTVDGDSKAETSLSEQSEYFRTDEYGPGTHELCFWVAGGSDARWEVGAKDCRSYNVTDTSTEDSTSVDTGSTGNTTGLNTCQVKYFNVNPGSPVVIGTDVLMEGEGSCDGGVRAVRFTVDGDSKAETSLPEQSEYFRTNEYGPGIHELCFWVSGGSDARWEAGAKSCIAYSVNEPRVYYYGYDTCPADPCIRIPADVDVLRLRSGPGSEHEAIGYVVPKNYYPLLEESDDWIRVRTTWNEGWVSRHYVEILNGEIDSSIEEPEQGSKEMETSDCATWNIGARVELRGGAEIRTGSGLNYSVHTIVPHDYWKVDIIGGPRYEDSLEWWDVSRKMIDAGGTGWVNIEQAGVNTCNEQAHPSSEVVDQEAELNDTSIDQNTNMDEGSTSAGTMSDDPLKNDAEDAITNPDESITEAQPQDVKPTSNDSNDNNLNRVIDIGADIIEIGATAFIEAKTTCAGMPPGQGILCTLLMTSQQATPPIVELGYEILNELGLLNP